MGKVTLTGEKVKIFAKEKQYNGGSFFAYRMGVSSKDKDGNWINGYLDCQFRKEVVIPDKSDINIKNAFPTCKENNGKIYVSWFISDFDIVSEGQPAQSNNDGWMNIPEGIDNELPFAKPSR